MTDTPPDDYQPFPDVGLESVARWHDRMAGSAATVMGRKYHAQCAAVCREARRGYAALNERTLTAELQIAQLLHNPNPFHNPNPSRDGR